MVANDFFKPAVTKHLARCIFGFDHPVRVKEEPIARLDWQLTNGVVGIGDNAKHNTVALDMFQLPFPQTKKRGMPGC